MIPSKGMFTKQVRYPNDESINVIKLMKAMRQNPMVLLTHSKRGIRLTALERFNLLQM